MAVFKVGEVFLVDDDAIVRMVASKILKSIDFNNAISAFENGQLAIMEITRRFENDELKNTAEPILILLDINMPVMDAWGFLDKFTEMDEEIKKNYFICIITSSIDSNDRALAFSYPDVKDYITKPLSGKHVIDLLSKHELYEK
ncbi:response regulator [Algoriphagus sp. A40]|uniref:response regulator n=1 Tax=Algoriphagus sp. A40 TaxID=1945863 RepID=UPI0009865986|nr:response regulator [Algoriphagus sp. A40]OOG74808.1 hypothetical protein B0E43_10495 [Algoriphagus sp. A40]